MGKLVDVDVAKKLTDEEIYWNDSKKADVRAFLHRLPAVDAVEVVRCGKCKHTDDVIYQDHEDQVWCQRAGYWKDNDWYCADGERRSDETD